MPFKSKAQMRACFATNGFNGKVDCREFAKETNYKSLPNKKEKGGNNMYRPKDCLKCGGKPKMQMGSLDFSFYTPPLPIDAPIGVDPEKEKDRIQEMIDRGLIDLPNSEGTSEQTYLDAVKKQKKPKQPWNAQEIGLTMQALRTGLGFFAGIKERARQNQYDWMQQTALGQMNPMPTDDFQPNPYSLYAKYGGNLKTIMKDYNKWTNDAHMDFGSGDEDKGMMKKGGYEIDRMLVVRKILPELLKLGRLGTGKYRGRQTGGYHKMPDGTMMRNEDMPRFTSQQQIDEANALAARFATEQGSIAGRNAYVARNVGDVMPQFLDSRTNKPYVGMPTKPLAKTLPRGVTSADILSENGAYWYNDPTTGDIVDIDPGIIPTLTPRKIPSMPMARLRKGGIHIKPENKGKFTEYCGGKVTDECIQKGLDSPSAVIRKRANFARNARKWK